MRVLFSHSKITNVKWKCCQSKLKRVVLKIEENCFARCGACTARREHYRSKNADRKMEINDYVKLFDALVRLKCKEVILSGGEPLLYEKLSVIVEEIKERAMDVTLNTNGGLLDEVLAQCLVEKGVDRFIVSIDSPHRDIHDDLRRCVGLYDKAVHGIKALVRLKRLPGQNIEVGIRMILSRYTFQDVPGMITLAKTLGCDSLDIDYIEYDFGQDRFLLDMQQIRHFRTHISEQIHVCLRDFPGIKPRDRKFNTKKIKNIYDFRLSSPESFSRGVYLQHIEPSLFCDLPCSFALILKNGDVAPCPAVDFTQHPVLGNLFDEDLDTIWHSARFRHFRKRRMNYCRRCPVSLSTTLRLQ